VLYVFEEYLRRTCSFFFFRTDNARDIHSRQFPVLLHGTCHITPSSRLLGVNECWVGYAHVY
jgi:hypothetical protein